MAWQVELDPRAVGELEQVDAKQAKRILRYLFERISTDGNPRRFGDPLRGNLAGLWRYRIGDYRVVCEIQDSELLVLVVRVAHRREVYR